MTQSGGVFIYSHTTKYNDLRIKKNNSVKIRLISRNSSGQAVSSVSL